MGMGVIVIGVATILGCCIELKLNPFDPSIGGIITSAVIGLYIVFLLTRKKG